MDKLKLFFLLLAVSLISMATSAFILKADGESTQSFTMQNRYALLSGPILVQSKFSTSSVRADAILKIDAVTGEVWILQLTIASPQQPTILSANFVATSFLLLA